MFEALLWAGVIILFLALFSAFDGSRDVFHPLVFIAPMLAFIYAWMPLQLLAKDGFSRFFENSQLVYVHLLTLAGITAFVVACLRAGVRIVRPQEAFVLSEESCRRIRIGAAIAGGVGLVCWTISIINVGGFVNAFSKSYSGGWDDSGYVRDASLLMLLGVLLLVTIVAAQGPRVMNVILLAAFALPWTAQAFFTARRGPTFAIVVIAAMGWYFSRNRRPPLLATAVAGLLLGWFVLFLVTNRSTLHLGSDYDVTTDVASEVTQSDTGNEYIYGAGSILSTERRDHYFWMRRYLAQILVRPIPSAIWPTKYEDFGVPELLHNAGTGEGFADALGWNGAPGSAPGIVADLFVEVWWLCVPAMALLGWMYGWLWRRAVTSGPAWACQYAIMSALSIYMVMQTMEAVIFRTLLLSIPCWIVWKWALPKSEEQLVPMRVIRIPAPESVSRG